MNAPRCQGMALWFVGLPGSGKSSVARRVHELLRAGGVDAVHLEMDARRKHYFPAPKYTKEEREQAYTMFVNEAASLAAEGHCVLMDGTAYEVRMRHLARERIARFAEVFVACTLETAIERESKRPQGQIMAGLYRKALERQRTGEQFADLGQVVGVDVPFEEDPEAELRLDSERLDVEQCAQRVLEFLRGE